MHEEGRHKCITCHHDQKADVEADGVLAIRGTISWAEAARRWGYNNHKTLKRHMENHWKSPEEEGRERAEDELLDTIVSAERELLDLAAVSPPQVKPLYLTAARNMRSLLDTKPSQQNLIAALKTAQEITGMKAQHQLLLAAGEAMFAKAELGAEKPAPKRPPAIEAPSEEVVEHG